MKKQHPSDVEFYRNRRKLNKILLPMTWPQRWAYINKEARTAVPNPKYLTPERIAEQEAYVKEALAKYRASPDANPLLCGEDSAEYNTQTT